MLGPESLRRRDFVRRLPVVGAGLAAGLSSLSGCGSVGYVTPTLVPAGLALPREALARSGGTFVQTTEMERPIYVRRLASGELTAVLASCTHRGCQPEPVGDRLACPCHGSEFDFTGAVLTGPAERPLERYAVSEEGDRIIVVIGTGARR